MAALLGESFSSETQALTALGAGLQLDRGLAADDRYVDTRSQGSLPGGDRGVQFQVVSGEAVDGMGFDADPQVEISRCSSAGGSSALPPQAQTLSVGSAGGDLYLKGFSLPP